MSRSQEHITVRAEASVRANLPVSSGLFRLDLQLDPEVAESSGMAAVGAGFLPGQFAMLNLAGAGCLVFSRPFSILDWRDGLVSFLYRVVGTGTRAMAALEPGDRMSVLGPLGRPFPSLDSGRSAVLIAGGVGLPPVAAWLGRYGKPGDVGFFGARDGADAPWGELVGNWQVSVDADRDVPSGRQAFVGRVTDLVASWGELDDGRPRTILACGPVPMLKAACDLALRRNWECLVSLEEHMGCGYGACKGCVVPVSSPDGGWRNATCCQDGPVFPAETILWERYGRNEFATVE